MVLYGNQAYKHHHGNGPVNNMASIVISADVVPREFKKQRTCELQQFEHQLSVTWAPICNLLQELYCDFGNSTRNWYGPAGNRYLRRGALPTRWILQAKTDCARQIKAKSAVNTLCLCTVLVIGDTYMSYTRTKWKPLAFDWLIASAAALLKSNCTTAALEFCERSR